MKISVLTWCVTRQDHLNKTLPRWLAQDYPDFEIILGHGPDIKWENNPKIVPVLTPRNKMCESYNAMLKAATGDLVLLTQCDIFPRSDSQISNMAVAWAPGFMVTDCLWKQKYQHEAWHKQSGMFLQCFLVAKKELDAIGGYDLTWDRPDLCAHEDGDIICTLWERRGLNYKFMETPYETGVLHLWHDRPDYHSPLTKNGKTNPVYIRFQKARELFWKKHDQKTINLFLKNTYLRIGAKRALSNISNNPPMITNGWYEIGD